MKNGYILSGILLLFTMVFTSIVAIDMQLEHRKQARYNLEQVKTCLNSINPFLSLHKSFETCTKDSRTSTTGDIYVLDGETLEFVHENSNDVPRELYFTKDSVGKYFKDWNSVKEALVYITSGKDSDNTYNTSYNFDGDTEWLEWVNYIHKDRWYIIVQGTQKDEVLNNYRYITYLIYLGVFLISFACIVLEKRGCK